MKTGLTIQQMAQELLRQSKAKQDYLVNTGSLSLSVTSDTQPPNRQPVNPRVWFETRGRAVLEALVTDLNSRGHSSLTVQENGEVFVQAKENEAEPAKETFLDFPEKVYWPQLVKVLEEEGYAADARDADILVSW